MFQKLKERPLIGLNLGLVCLAILILVVVTTVELRFRNGRGECAAMPTIMRITLPASGQSFTEMERARVAEERVWATEGALKEAQNQVASHVAFEEELGSPLGWLNIITRTINAIAKRLDRGLYSNPDLVAAALSSDGLDQKYTWSLLRTALFASGPEGVNRFFGPAELFIRPLLTADMMEMLEAARPLLAKPIDWDTAGKAYLVVRNQCRTPSDDPPKACGPAQKLLSDIFEIDASEEDSAGRIAELTYNLGIAYRRYLEFVPMMGATRAQATMEAIRVVVLRLLDNKE